MNRTKIKDMNTFEKIVEGLAGIICAIYIIGMLAKWQVIAGSIGISEVVLGVLFALDGVAQVRTQKALGFGAIVIGVIFIIVGAIALK